MKKYCVVLISTLSLCTTALSSANENQVDARSISHILVDIARAPLSRTHGQSYATTLLATGENIMHGASKLNLQRKGNAIQVMDVVRGETIWERNLADVLYTSLDKTGEYLEVCCRNCTDFFADDTEHLVYRVSFVSTLQQLNNKQLAFMRTCYDYWKTNKQPFLVMQENEYTVYRTLPEDLKQRTIFQLSDAMRRRAERDYYKSWITLPFDAMRYLASCCRTCHHARWLIASGM